MTAGYRAAPTTARRPKGSKRDRPPDGVALVRWRDRHADERRGTPVTRYVITPDVALRLAEDRTVVTADHDLLAPSLIRSQLLSMLYEAVGRGELTRQEAEQRLAHVRSLRMRLLGDRVLQRNAWDIAAELGWPDTFDAEYVALTRLQADALVTLDATMAGAVQGLVRVAPIDELL